MAYKGLYVDDLRPLPKEYNPNVWDVARSFHEAVYKLDTVEYDILSLDHDLASFYGYREMTGYDIVVWLAQRKIEGKGIPSDIRVHSANPVGSKNIQDVIDNLRKY